jgi:hypothetical protein
MDCSAVDDIHRRYIQWIIGRGNGTVLRIAETWRWLLCNELTFIQLSAFVGLF